MARSVRAFLIEIGAETRDFLRGTQQADDALDDLARDSQRDLDKIGRAAKDAAEDMERAFEASARESAKAFRKVGQDAGNEMGGGAVKESFGEAGSEVGAEFASNLGESLASGDLSGVARDTAGGLVSAFAGIAGPIGVGLAGAAAVATSIFGKLAADAEAKAARVKEVTTTLFEEMSASLNDAIGEITRGEAYNSFVAGFSKDGDLADGLKQMQDLARKAGVNVGDIAAAFINGGPAAEQLKAKLAKIKQEGTTISANAKGQQTSLNGSATAAKTLTERIGEADQATKDANQSARAYWESWIGITAEARLAEAAASRASSALHSAAEAAAKVNGAPGTVVGGRRLD